MQISIPVENSVQIIESTEISPLISKCKIKVLYIGENRNGTYFSRETAEEMGKKLPGSPIVGYYNEEDKDFQEHDRELQINEDGSFALVELTKPYGFVDINAKVYFEDFEEDGEVRTYLVTEGYIWTEAYPECKRIAEKGNNQSMELNQNSVKGNWTISDKNEKRIFIINEAIIEKLCILGENYEPCFEGAQIKTEFSLEKEFEELKNTLFSMMNELKQAVDKGGKPVYTVYALELGHVLVDLIYTYMYENGYYNYSLQGVYKEEDSLFAIFKDRNNGKMMKLSFNYDEQEGFVPAEEIVDVTLSFVPSETSQFNLEELKVFEENFVNKMEQQKEEEEEEDKKEEEDEDDYACKKEKKEDYVEDKKEEEDEEEEEEDEDEKKKYVLEENEEYTLLLNKYSVLENELADLKEKYSELKEYKLAKEREEKQEMINSFYMLSDEDKKDVVENIDTYSLDDIEAKLSVICVRNKVNFNLEEEDNKDGLIFNLNGNHGDDNLPEWVKAVKNIEC